MADAEATHDAFGPELHRLFRFSVVQFKRSPITRPAPRWSHLELQSLRRLVPHLQTKAISNT